jgi:hypothetical protein
LISAGSVIFLDSEGTVTIAMVMPFARDGAVEGSW